MSAPEPSSPPSVEQLRARLSFSARAVGLAFGVMSVLLGGVVVAAGSGTAQAWRQGAILGGAGLGVSLALSGLLRWAGRARRRALLSGSLRRGEGRLERIVWPDDGGGGSTVLTLALRRPDGSTARGKIRVHSLDRKALAEGASLVLWFSEDQRSFVLDLDLRCDPGRVLER